MKNVSFLAALLTAIVVIFSGCKKDGPTQNQQDAGNATLQFTYRLNGTLVDHSDRQPYASHYTESIDGSSTYSGTMVSDYNVSTPNDTSLIIIFPSKSTGSWTDQTESRMTLSCPPAGPAGYYAIGTCSIGVTRYGAVNEVVAGTFSGTLVSYSDTATISGGIFTVRRMD